MKAHLDLLGGLNDGADGQGSVRLDFRGHSGRADVIRGRGFLLLKDGQAGAGLVSLSLHVGSEAGQEDAGELLEGGFREAGGAAELVFESCALLDDLQEASRPPIVGNLGEFAEDGRPGDVLVQLLVALEEDTKLDILSVGLVGLAPAAGGFEPLLAPTAGLAHVVLARTLRASWERKFVVYVVVSQVPIVFYL